MECVVKKDVASCNWKGWCWEMTVDSAVCSVPNVVYQSNSKDFSVWLRSHNARSYDGLVTLPSGYRIKIECKYRDFYKVFHSWFMKDWLPRDCDIVVTNDTNVISYRDRRLLESQGKKLMSLSEFVVYLSTLVRSVGLYSVFCVVSGVCGCCIRVFERF